MAARFPRRAAVLLLVVMVAVGAAGCGRRTTFYDTATPPITATPWTVNTNLAEWPVPEPETSTTTVAPVPPAELPAETPSVGATRAVVKTAAPSDIKVTGRIEIPKIGLSHTTYEGNTLREINYGPSHWPGSAMPGHPGNAVFAGHRTTYSRPFFDLDLLSPGDQVVLTTAQGRFVYEVVKSFIVSPSDMWIVHPTPEAMVTLFACHPKGSAKQRIVVRGRLVSAPVAAPQKAQSPAQKSPPPPPTTTTTSPPRRNRCTLCLP